MAKFIDAKCVVCGKEYKIKCPECTNGKEQPAWMSIYHNENCKDIYNVCVKFNANMLTKDQAKAIIDKCDLSYRKDFTESTNKILDEILAEKNILEKAIDNKLAKNKAKQSNKKIESD